MSDSNDEVIACQDFESDDREMKLAKRESSTVMLSQKAKNLKLKNKKPVKPHPLVDAS